MEFKILQNWGKIKSSASEFRTTNLWFSKRICQALHHKIYYLIYTFRKLDFGDGKEILLLSIPSFSDSRSIILLNLNNLEAESITFDYISNEK